MRVTRLSSWAPLRGTERASVVVVSRSTAAAARRSRSRPPGAAESGVSTGFSVVSPAEATPPVLCSICARAASRRSCSRLAVRLSCWTPASTRSRHCESGSVPAGRRDPTLPSDGPGWPRFAAPASEPLEPDSVWAAADPDADEPELVPPLAPVSSAQARPAPADIAAAPTPSATANAPTRPTYFEEPTAGYPPFTHRDTESYEERHTRRAPSATAMCLLHGGTRRLAHSLVEHYVPQHFTSGRRCINGDPGEAHLPICTEYFAIVNDPAQQHRHATLPQRLRTVAATPSDPPRPETSATPSAAPQPDSQIPL